MRCYNGCPDSDLQRLLDSIEAARKRLKKAFPNAHCTYFPMEQKYLVFNCHKPVGKFQDNEIFACDEAIRLLTTQKQK